MRVPSLSLPAPNRIAVYITSLAALGAAVAPVVADLDLTSTVGVLGGLGAIVGVVVKWLDGWQKHETRLAVPASADPAVIAAAIADGLAVEVPGATEGVKPTAHYIEPPAS